MSTRWGKGRESTGCEQEQPRSTAVSLQQHMALDDTAVITLPHISLCGGGGPRSPSLLQGKFSSKGMGLRRIRTAPLLKAAAASTHCGRFSATEISCQSPSTTYKLIHHRLYHHYRGICRIHASTLVSRFTVLYRLVKNDPML